MKEPREQIANPSHDTQLQDHLADEMLLAHEAKDHRRMRQALCALIMHYRNEDADAAMAK